MVDVSKIREGDTIVVKSVVTKVYPRDREPGPSFQLPTDCFGGAAIVEHIPAPREFKVGDKVLVDAPHAEGTGEVLAIHPKRQGGLWVEGSWGASTIVSAKYVKHIDPA